MPKSKARNLTREFFFLKKKAGKLPPLSVAEERIVEGDSMVSSVYSSARLEGSQLTKEEVEKIIASDNSK